MKVLPRPGPTHPLDGVRNRAGRMLGRARDTMAGAARQARHRARRMTRREHGHGRVFVPRPGRHRGRPLAAKGRRGRRPMAWRGSGRDRAQTRRRAHTHRSGRRRERSRAPMAVVAVAFVAAAGTVVWLVVRQRRRIGEEVAAREETQEDGQGRREAGPAASERRSVDVSA